VSAEVTVVTVSWEAADLTLECLAGLAAQQLDDVRVDVVVVDNGSTDGTAARVAAAHPGVRVVRSSTNRGFAGGNNLALRDVRTPWVLLLNNDAVPDPDAIRTLVHAARRAPADVAALAPTVLLAERFRAAAAGEAPDVVGPDGRWVSDPDGDVRLVNSTGNEIRTDGFGVDRGWLADATRHDPPSEVFGFSGAAALLRTAALRDVGLFDERFFMYYEDSDLSWRLRLAGWRVLHCPGAVVSHAHAASSREGSDFFVFHDARNRLAMLTKDATTGLVVRSLVRFVLTSASLALRRRRPWRETRVRLRVLVSYARMAPGLVVSRCRLRRDARVARRVVESLLVPPRPTGGYRPADAPTAKKGAR
jgi:GT2 family glycosyltransferase